MRKFWAKTHLLGCLSGTSGVGVGCDGGEEGVEKSVGRYSIEQSGKLSICTTEVDNHTLMFSSSL